MGSGTRVGAAGEGPTGERIQLEGGREEEGDGGRERQKRKRGMEEGREGEGMEGGREGGRRDGRKKGERNKGGEAGKVMVELPPSSPTLLLSPHSPQVVRVPLSSKEEAELGVVSLLLPRHLLKLWPIASHKVCQLVDNILQLHI